MVKALRWGIKASFLDYIDALADAVITMEDGVARDGDVFVFPKSKDSQKLGFGGCLGISAHAGALNLTFRDPAVERAQDGVLYLKFTVGSQAIRVARILDSSADEELLASEGGRLEEVALTLEGSGLFAGTYGPWARMGPLTLTD